MTALAHSRSRYQGALSPACVGLSRQCNAESGIGCEPRRAGPGARCCVVVALAKGDGHYLRTTPNRNARQTPAEWPYNLSELP